MKNKNTILKQVPARDNRGKQVPARDSRERQVPVGDNRERQVPARDSRERQVPARDSRERQVPARDSRERQVPARDSRERQVPARDSRERQVPVGDNIENLFPNIVNARRPFSIQNDAELQASIQGNNDKTDTDQDELLKEMPFLRETEQFGKSRLFSDHFRLILQFCKDHPAYTQEAILNFQMLNESMSEFMKAPAMYAPSIGRDLIEDDGISFAEKNKEADNLAYEEYVQTKLSEIYGKPLKVAELRKLIIKIAQKSGKKVERLLQRSKVKMIVWFFFNWEQVESMIYEHDLDKLFDEETNDEVINENNGPTISHDSDTDTDRQQQQVIENERSSDEIIQPNLNQAMTPPHKQEINSDAHTQTRREISSSVSKNIKPVNSSQDRKVGEKTSLATKKNIKINEPNAYDVLSLLNRHPPASS